MFTLVPRTSDAVRFNDLGDHILGLAGTHRNVKALEQAEKPTREKVQQNQEKGTVVAGA